MGVSQSEVIVRHGIAAGYRIGTKDGPETFLSTPPSIQATVPGRL